MTFHEKAIFPRGFQCASRNCGLKVAGPDLSVFYSEVSAAAAAVFTRNRFPGAPVIVGREVIRGGSLRAIVVNSKISNVGTGAEGVANARRMAELAAQALAVPAGEVLMSSTGVIGKQLPMERLESGLRGIASDLQSDPFLGAEGIMTTDTYPKAVSLQVGDAVVTLVGKGSGMIEPDLATMLVYIFTDAELSARSLDRMLRAAVADTFNMLSVDSDTSTSDTCAIMANGLAGHVDEGAFEAALRAGCLRMTEMLARDGEGATKLLRASVAGAVNQGEARRIAKSIINSPLVKTMAYGADPNAGRILMAVGKCTDCEQDPGRISVWINDIHVFRSGERAVYEETRLRELMAGDPVDIRVDLGLGDGGATAFGCDLTHGYIDENAAYYSS
ncbi:MAG TPA: bifunctional glutamate N-acetyltransferase/amino-acid acetyltransferase ArgJ [Longimicrobiaceae bacterium]|nr:bifunctional glutamate N-acetyltransferase/amino-acid acetyltransferase ArgJ [Longimicrobiaceae bacterium]